MSTMTPTNPGATGAETSKRRLGSREAWLLGVCCVGAVHGHPRPEHRQRRAALDPVEPRLHGARTAVDRRCLRDHLRGLLDARRPRRRPLRPAPHVRDRAARVRARLAGRRARDGPRDADPCSRGAGLRRRADGGMLAGGHHLLVRARAEAQPRDRRVGGDERTRRRRRDAVRRADHPGAQLALGAADQPADRDRCRDRGLRGRQRAPPRPRTHFRPCRSVDAHDRPDGAGVRRRRSRAGRLGHLCRARPDRRGHRPAGGVRRDRDAPGQGSADPLQGADQAAADRQQHRAAVQRVAVSDVVRQLALPAAGAGPLAAAYRTDLPADDVDDHAGRLARPASSSAASACAPCSAAG